ncbi:CaiB/baiF CoA-transferase family protein ZK892.4 [Caenorhabditis elegans]|uniref:CaiB/baiF CoA-transferase family protein ZK892.4 n=1 Tax=Caenorhabditis elegans TaxID=6239 RepID=YS74_CAEEL|nr:CaiB/baiF CoA-transferase family protein ZK892.4 [Caenorhabditis elegans]Q09618.3 RecName: Full=CaiB/baiF CoA-transferase family protein ZK892.4 [Caenorhabditis elegans]CAA88571.2 CaiB/baiF CoA-transferase family protein ZK892.4 [Caenorhabditis elegans]|eukprot:NP_496163.2 CaiB/baiF CoA-transferase family protein ZK892.4 [Caenorhabditis elegans]
MYRFLSGIKVVEIAGLAPVPHCGMMLADFGADVTVIDKKNPAIEQRLNRGKTMKQLDLKNPEDIKKVRDLCQTSDVLLDPYRPGTLEKMGLDPSTLWNNNKGLIICKISGYGQTGRMSQETGHDINYVALSGMLPTFSGVNATRPWPPANMLADFAGGGLSAAFGILSAIYARSHNGGKGCLLDCSMTEGVAYLSSFVQHYYDQPNLFTDKYALFSGECPIYRTYKTKDDKFVAVGAVEPKFYQNLFKLLNVDGRDLFVNPGKITEDLESRFLQKTRDKWANIFKGQECCVTPVLDIHEVGSYGQHVDRNSFTKTSSNWIANPSPRVWTQDELAALSSKK